MGHTKYYKLVWDESQIKEWYDKVVAPLEKDEVYVLMLTARKKYSPVPLSYKSEFISHQYLKEGTYEELIQKLYRWECRYGSWMDRKTGNVIPNEALAVYMDVNPKSTLRGVKSFINEMLSKLFELQSNPEGVYHHYRRFYVRLYANIVSSNSRKLYVLIDIDGKEKELVQEVLDYLSTVKDSIVTAVETRGGYHLLYRLDKSKENNKYLFGELRPLFKEEYKYKDERGNVKYLVEIKPQALTVIPGTIQGGFQVHIVDIS